MFCLLCVRYNVTEDILPFTSYDFQVSVCNSIGCSVFTDPVTVMTAEDGKTIAQRPNFMKLFG